MASIEAEKTRCKRYRDERRDAGKCPSCGGERDADGIICRTCLDNERRRRLFRRYFGLCSTCGVRPAYSPILGENPKTCETCLMKRYIKRKQLNKKGLCKCGSPIKQGSVSSCESCLSKYRANSKKYRAKRRNQISNNP